MLNLKSLDIGATLGDTSFLGRPWAGPELLGTPKNTYSFASPAQSQQDARTVLCRASGAKRWGSVLKQNGLGARLGRTREQEHETTARQGVGLDKGHLRPAKQPAPSLEG